MGVRVGGGRLARTVKSRADESPGGIGFLERAQMLWDLWSVRVIGPRLLLRARHYPDVYDEGFWQRVGLDLGRGGGS